MPSLRYFKLSISGARSLTWQGDRLVDWLRALRSYGLDGSETPGRMNLAYRFDAVVQSPGGRYTVVYERRGTKGLVLCGERIVREINRSYYFAQAYDYPIALFRSADGRELIAHCPENYDQLDVEDLETGERLTARQAPAFARDDFFHSGLEASPGGAWLMSAGWIWHPFLGVKFYSVEHLLTDPSSLDRADGHLRNCAGIASAAFVDKGRAVLASAPDAEHFFDDDDDPEMELRPGMIGVYRPATQSWDCRAPISEPMGRLLVIDADHALALFKHPKLIHLPTGRVIEHWPDVPSGTWNGCIEGREPPTAWDPERKRLAIASEDSIHVLFMEEAGVSARGGPARARRHGAA